MPTRYNSQSKTRFNVPGLPTGYDSKAAPEGLTVPSVGIEDAERALFHLFDKEIPFTVDTQDGLKKVPVIFAAGEKWVLLKKKRALRDSTGSLILPLITIVRTSIEQAPDADIAGRGINQQTGEIVIHRRLDKSDRAYQGLINRLLLKHQTNLAVGVTEAELNQIATDREIGDLSDDPQVGQGMLLLPDRRNNVYETIVVPAPRFYTAHYDVTVWSQYTMQMTGLIEQLINSQLPQGNCWRIDTPAGYWFIAKVDDNTYTADNNTDDFSQSERLTRTKFTISLAGYIMASSVPGAPVPIKRYVSSPSISFSLDIPSAPASGLDDPFLGADDPTLPLDSGDDAPSRRRDMRNVNGTRLYQGGTDTNPDDPALKSLRRGTVPAQFRKISGVDKNGNRVTKLLRVRSTNNAFGETVLAADATLDGLTFVITED